jgi:hypothetical protein
MQNAGAERNSGLWCPDTSAGADGGGATAAGDDLGSNANSGLTYFFIDSSKVCALHAPRGHPRLPPVSTPAYRLNLPLSVALPSLPLSHTLPVLGSFDLTGAYAVEVQPAPHGFL